MKENHKFHGKKVFFVLAVLLIAAAAIVFVFVGRHESEQLYQLHYQDNLINSGNVFYDQSGIYYAAAGENFSEPTIYKTDLKGEQKQIISHAAAAELCVSGDKIYYIHITEDPFIWSEGDEYYSNRELCSMNLDGTDNKVLLDVRQCHGFIQGLQAVDGMIYFSGYSNDDDSAEKKEDSSLVQCLYKYNPSSDKNEVCLKNTDWCIYVAKNKIYYMHNDEPTALYEYDANTETETKLFDLFSPQQDSFSISDFILDENKVYFACYGQNNDASDEGIYCYNLAEEKCSQLIKAAELSGFAVTKGTIYYIASEEKLDLNDNKGSVWKYNLENGSTEQVDADPDTRRIYITPAGLYKAKGDMMEGARASSIELVK